jgi:hypothetical protein
MDEERSSSSLEAELEPAGGDIQSSRSGRLPSSSSFAQSIWVLGVCGRVEWALGVGGATSRLETVDSEAGTVGVILGTLSEDN